MKHINRSTHPLITFINSTQITGQG